MFECELKQAFIMWPQLWSPWRWERDPSHVCCSDGLLVDADAFSSAVSLSLYSFPWSPSSHCSQLPILHSPTPSSLKWSLSPFLLPLSSNVQSPSSFQAFLAGPGSLQTTFTSDLKFKQQLTSSHTQKTHCHTLGFYCREKQIHKEKHGFLGNVF